jgi:hypothetical protein
MSLMTLNEYESLPPKEKEHRGVDLISDALPFGSTERNQQCNRLRKILQPLT